MLKYIIRLDDACPNMDIDKWERIETIFDKYNIKPIVGIIPNCKDKEFEKYSTINNFWEDIAINYQKKGWIISQHGNNHNLSKTIRTEFEGKTYDSQLNILNDGFNTLKKHGIKPICFFAPNHTFDKNTILACKNSNNYKFISDGYAFYPFSIDNMLFFPSVFDTPHCICPFGIWTFVYHPNNMEESDFIYLEKFIIKHQKKFDVNIESLIKSFSNRKRNIFDFMLEKIIFVFRRVRGKNEK